MSNEEIQRVKDAIVRLLLANRERKAADAVERIFPEEIGMSMDDES